MRGDIVTFKVLKQTKVLTPVSLHEITLETLMATPSLPQEQETYLAAAIADERLFAKAWPFDPLQRMLDIAAEHDLLAKAVPCSVTGYLIATHSDEVNGPIVAIFEQNTGTLAGAAHWKNIIVRGPYQGCGIGTELSIKAYEIGLFHPDLMNETNFLSAGGRKLRKTAHRAAVQRALESGIKVSSEVLKDYPDLTPTPRRDPREALISRVRSALLADVPEVSMPMEKTASEPSVAAGRGFGR